MKFLQLPIPRLYILEIDLLIKAERWLALILTLGALNELAVKEIAGKEGRMEGLLTELRKERKLTEREFQVSDEIRKIRNKYMHIHAKKIAEPGTALIEESGFLKLWSDFSEEDMRTALLFHLREDSTEITRIFSEFILWLRTL